MKREPLSPRNAGVVVAASNSSASLVAVRYFRDVRRSFADGSVSEEDDENVAPPAASAVAKKRRGAISRLKLGRNARLLGEVKKMVTGRGKHKNDQAASQSLVKTDSGRGEHDQANHSTTITAAVVTKPAYMPRTSADGSSDTPKSSSTAASAERKEMTKEITTTTVVTKLATTHMSSAYDLSPMDPSRDQSQSSNTTKPSTASNSDPPNPSSTAASSEALSVFPIKHRHAKITPRSSPYGDG